MNHPSDQPEPHGTRPADNDLTERGAVDDLARALCREWDNTPADPCGEPHPCPAHLREARAVLGSGVVASARDVKALADEMARFSEDYRRCPSSPAREAYRFAAVRLTTLLREPATDATPAEASPRKCGRCEGCGQIANDEDGSPWSAWASLPPGSDLAVRMGLVRPIPCPECAAEGGEQRA